MSTTFFTDSTADLPASYLSKHPRLKIIPLWVRINGKEYNSQAKPGEDAYMSERDFYARMRAGSTPTTAQITQQTFMEFFEPELKSGADIFYIAFSSALSGTYDSACLAARELMQAYPGRSVRVVDSRSASLGEGMVVYLALTAHEAGMDDASLEAYIHREKMRVHHWFTVDDLIYLKRGGRVSGAAAAIGTVLNIKPMLNVDDAGHLIPKEKTQGRKRALKALVDHMAQNVNLPYQGPIFLSHGDCAQEAALVARMIRERFGRDPDEENFITPIIGAHAGPGTVALFFLGDRERG